MPFIQDEWEKKWKVEREQKDIQIALEKEAEEEARKRRIALAEEDRKNCLATAYAPGTICIFFKEYETWPGAKLLSFNGRQCKIVEVCPVEPKWNYGKDDKSGILAENSLLVENLKYRIVFLPDSPMCIEEDPGFLVRDRDIISLAEAVEQSSIDAETDRFGRHITIVKPYRDFERKGYYDRPSAGGGGHSVGSSGAGSQI